MIKLIAFDLDGTIGDTIPLCMRAFRKAVASYTDHELSDNEIVQTFGLNEEGMIKQVVSDDHWKRALEDFYLIYEEMHMICPHPFEGILGLINDLRARDKIVVLITGKGAGSCAITLKQFGMQNSFDRIETGSSEKNRKSESMLALRQYYRIKPNEMIYVGDTVSDIEACNATGIRCLSAAWATSTMRGQLDKCNFGYVFDSVLLLREYLLNEQ